MARVSGGAVPRFIQVRCPAGNRRRAGRAFDATFQVFAEGEIDGDELALLVSDPALEVQGSGDGEGYVTIVGDDVPAAESGEVQRLVDPVAGDLDDVTKERDTLKGEVEDLTEERDRLKLQTSQLSGQLSEANSNLARMTGERDEALEGHKRVVDQLEAAQARIVELGGPAPGDKPVEEAAIVTDPATVDETKVNPVKPAKAAKTDKAQGKS